MSGKGDVTFYYCSMLLSSWADHFKYCYRHPLEDCSTITEKESDVLIASGVKLLLVHHYSCWHTPTHTQVTRCDYAAPPKPWPHTSTALFGHDAPTSFPRKSILRLGFVMFPQCSSRSNITVNAQ